QYFTDHEAPGLADAVRNGRRAEFAAHGWPPEQVPDPQDVATFTRSKLDWKQPDEPAHADLLDWYRRLLRLRRSVPELTDPAWSSVRCAYDEQARYFVVYRGDTTGGRGGVAVVCNLATTRQAVPVDRAPVDVLTASAPGFTFAPTYVELDAESVVVTRLVGDPGR
nr:DUF3459 domain-containing protein [Micromonospora sp. DSM 115978]